MARIVIVQADVSGDELAQAVGLALGTAATARFEVGIGRQIEATQPAPPAAPTRAGGGTDPARKPAKATRAQTSKPRACIICGKNFDGHPRRNTCSDECKRERARQTAKASYIRQQRGDSPRSVPCQDCGVLYGEEALSEGMCAKCRRLGRSEN